MRQAIVVLGMHRSGTSAFAGALCMSGAQLPRNLSPPLLENPQGFFESEKITVIHDRLLAAAGTSWFGLRTIPDEWYQTAQAASFIEELVDAVLEEYESATPFVVKDPRMCRLMPIWREVFDRLRVKPYFFLPLRSPLEVAHSLGQRNSFPIAYSYLLWLEHVIEAEYQTRGQPRIFESYSVFLRDPARVIDRGLAQFRLQGLALTQGATGDISSLIDAGLRHHAVKLDDFELSSVFFPWVLDAYTALNKLIQSANDEAAQQELDEIRAYSKPAVASFHNQSLPDLQAKAQILDRELNEHTQQSDTAIRLLSLQQLDRDRLKRLIDIVAEKEHKIAQLERAIAERKIEHDNPGRAIVASEFRINALETTVLRIHGSTSWRVTEPLRWAKRVSGRFRYSTAGYPLRIAWKALWMHSRVPLREWRDARVIARSGLLDKDWYVATNDDVAKQGIDPVRHYVTFGAREGRDPSPSFSTLQYLANNPDVAAANINPLSHFVIRGMVEGRVVGCRNAAVPPQPQSRSVSHNNWAVLGAGAMAVLHSAARQSGGIAPLALKCLRVLRDEGFGGYRRRLLVLRQSYAPVESSEYGGDAKEKLSRSFGIAPVDIPKALANAQRWCAGEKPEVSILIINWNATPLTLECVRQIWANSEGVSYEIIIVDNGSDPRDIAPLKNLGSGTRLIELGINRFFGEANNIAAEHAQGKYLCFLNNDAFVQPGWLRSLVREI